jgi:hypothetical protein
MHSAPAHARRDPSKARLFCDVLAVPNDDVRIILEIGDKETGTTQMIDLIMTVRISKVARPLLQHNDGNPALA